MPILLKGYFLSSSWAFTSCSTDSCMVQPFRVIPESVLCERLCSLFIFPHQQSIKGKACIFFFFPTSFLLSQHCILCCCWQDTMLLLQQTKCKLASIVVYHLIILSAFSICEGPWEIMLIFISLHQFGKYLELTCWCERMIPFRSTLVLWWSLSLSLGQWRDFLLAKCCVQGMKVVWRWEGHGGGKGREWGWSVGIN